MEIPFVLRERSGGRLVFCVSGMYRAAMVAILAILATALLIDGGSPGIGGLLALAATALAALYEELGQLDPLGASRMESTNARRVVRALEVCLGSGRPFSSFGAGLRSYGPVRVVQVGLRRDFETLDVQIEERFRSWIDQGLVDEVATLAALPGGLSRTARQAVGYRELLRYVEEDAPLEQCISDAIVQSRRLARRQRSWFQRDPRIEWFDEASAAGLRIREVLNSPDGFVRD